jgi:hypothetical protein
LAFQSGSKAVGAVKTFASAQTARTWLHDMAAAFDLDQRLLGLSMFDANRDLPATEAHNSALELALADFLSRDASYIIASNGRSEGEFGYVLVERGVLKGYAFLQEEIQSADDLFFHLKPLQHSENTSSILEAFDQSRWGYRRIEISETAMG